MQHVQLGVVDEPATTGGSSSLMIERAAAWSTDRSERSNDRPCARSMRPIVMYITASTRPHGELHPMAATSRLCTSALASAALIAPVNVSTMMRPNRISEIRETGSSTADVRGLRSRPRARSRMYRKGYGAPMVDLLPSTSEHADELAVVTDAATRTWAQLERNARRVANGLASLGLTVGDRWALLSHNRGPVARTVPRQRARRHSLRSAELAPDGAGVGVPAPQQRSHGAGGGSGERGEGQARREIGRHSG